MKKVIISAALVCLAGFTYAQKPTAGAVTGEVELHFQTGNGFINVASPDFKARYFLADDMALRLKLGVTTNSNSTDVLESIPGGDTAETGTVDVSNSSFRIGVGIEKHYAGTTRLSPYIGAEIGFSTGSSSRTYDQAIDDVNSSTGYSFSDGRSEDVSGASHTTFSIGILAGADYYFVDNVYLGIEAGLAFSTTSDGESTSVVSNPGVPSTTTTTSGGSSSGISNNVNSGLRLGFRF